MKTVVSKHAFNWAAPKGKLTALSLETLQITLQAKSSELASQFHNVFVGRSDARCNYPGNTVLVTMEGKGMRSLWVNKENMHCGWADILYRTQSLSNDLPVRQLLGVWLNFQTHHMKVLWNSDTFDTAQFKWTNMEEDYTNLNIN